MAAPEYNGVPLPVQWEDAQQAGWSITDEPSELQPDRIRVRAPNGDSRTFVRFGEPDEQIWTNIRRMLLESDRTPRCTVN